MSSLVIIQQMTVIAILVVIGFYLQKKSVLNGDSIKSISKITIDICNPALIVATVLTGNITVSHNEFIIGLLIGIIFYLILSILGKVLPKILGIPSEDRKFYNLMTVYTNVGFMGIPIAKAVLTENAIIYVIICTVIYSLLFYTHGVVTLSDGSEKFRIKDAISPGTVLAVVTLLIFWFNITLPTVIVSSLSYIGNATVFLSMILLGAAVARSSIIEGIKNIKLWWFILIRMIILPLIFLMFLKGLKLPSDMILAFVLMSAVPVGNLPLIQAEKTNQKTDILSQSIIITTIVSFITITVLMWIAS